jgi:CheY-like chemotaxis protein
MKQIARLMLIDDDPVVIKICKSLFEKNHPHLQTLEFTDPVKAVEFFEASDANAPATLVLLDINMPEVSAWQVLDRIEKLPASVQARYNIFILTSSVDKVDYRQAEQRKNVLGYLVKPFFMHTLREIRRILKDKHGWE